MGNFVIYISLAAFALLWIFYADALCFKILKSFGIPNRLSEKSAWVLGLVIITIGLLLAFALMGVSLAHVLSGVFDSAAQVSQKGIAVGILASLCTSWLLSLSRLRARIEEIYESLGASSS